MVARASGKMTHRQYRKALDTLGISQRAAANLLGIDERTSRRFALGEREVPRTIARFLRVLSMASSPRTWSSCDRASNLGAAGGRLP